MFPSIVNCCTIDWFSEWPEEALKSVATSAVTETDLELGNSLDGVVAMIKGIHQDSSKASADFLDELRRYNFVFEGDSDGSVNADLDSLDVDGGTVLKLKDVSSGEFVKSIGESDEFDVNSSLEDLNLNVVSVPDDLELLSVSVDDNLDLLVEVLFKFVLVNLEKFAELDSDVNHSFFGDGLEFEVVSVVGSLEEDSDYLKLRIKKIRIFFQGAYDRYYLKLKTVTEKRMVHIRIKFSKLLQVY
jgi:hypothetical protein